MALLLAVAFGVLLLDQVTKHFVMERIPFGASISIAGDFLQFTHIRNRGVAFGLLSDQGIPFVFVSLVAMLLIVLSLRRVPREAQTLRLALAAILGGACGNLIDRLRFREVVDFIEVGVGRFRWPVFNVADIAVTTGVFLFIAASLLGRREAVRPDADEGGAPLGPA
jgi:signal peptidase II